MKTTDKQGCNILVALLAEHGKEEKFGIRNI